MKERRCKGAVPTVIAALCFGGMAGVHYLSQITKAYVQDLNNDEIPDLLVETKDGLKYPLYGISIKGKIQYLSACEFAKQHPNKSLCNHTKSLPEVIEK